MEYNKNYKILLFSMDKVPKFRQECIPKCRPIPKDSKTAKTDTETDISAEISADTETDNFLSLLSINISTKPSLSCKSLNFKNLDREGKKFNFRQSRKSWQFQKAGLSTHQDI
jgi:hypothetical protein